MPTFAARSFFNEVYTLRGDYFGESKVCVCSLNFFLKISRLLALLEFHVRLCRKSPFFVVFTEFS